MSEDQPPGKRPPRWRNATGAIGSRPDALWAPSMTAALTPADVGRALRHAGMLLARLPAYPEQRAPVLDRTRYWVSTALVELEALIRSADDRRHARDLERVERCVEMVLTDVERLLGDARDPQRAVLIERVRQALSTARGELDEIAAPWA